MCDKYQFGSILFLKLISSKGHKFQILIHTFIGSRNDVKT